MENNNSIIIYESDIAACEFIRFTRFIGDDYNIRPVFVNRKSEKKKEIDPFYFINNDNMPKDVEGVILSFLPYEYKGVFAHLLGDEKFTEKHIHHYKPHKATVETYDRSTKNKVKEYYFINGQLSGVYREWFPNGELMVCCGYLNGLKHGNYTSWYESGIKRKECVYLKDRFIGKHSEWWHDGQLMLESHYRKTTYNKTIQYRFKHYNDDENLIYSLNSDGTYISTEWHSKKIKKCEIHYAPNGRIEETKVWWPDGRRFYCIGDI